MEIEIKPLTLFAPTRDSEEGTEVPIESLTSNGLISGAALPVGLYVVEPTARFFSFK